MAKWTVDDGDQQFVIESGPKPGLTSLTILTGSSFVTDADHLRELRAKISLAIGSAQAINATPDDHGGHGVHKSSPGGEDRA